MGHLQKGSKKLIRAWASYDLANSVYFLVITEYRHVDDLVSTKFSANIGKNESKEVSRDRFVASLQDSGQRYIRGVHALERSKRRKSEGSSAQALSRNRRSGHEAAQAERYLELRLHSPSLG